MNLSPHATRRWCRALVTAATCLATTAAHAQSSDTPPEVVYDYGEFAQPRGAALGGAIRAFGNSLDALYANPANLAATKIYHLGATAQFWPTASRAAYGGGVVDSVTSRIAGGAAAQYLRQSPDDVERVGTDVRLGLALPVSKALLLGVAGRHLWMKQDGLGPLGPSLASSGRSDRLIVKELTFDAGATLRPAKGLAIAAVGQNLTNADHGFLPLTTGGGIGFGTEDFTVEADAVGDFRTWGHPTLRAMSGVEFLAGDHYPLRLGYRFDSGAESHAVTAGIAYLERAFSASLAIRQVVAGDPVTALFFGFEYHFEGTGNAPTPADGF